MTSESDMRAAGAFAAEVFPVDGFDGASFGAAVFDANVVAAAGFATLEDFAVVRAAAFFTGFFAGM
ncbi:MAG: hypothetical protein SGJ19_29610 [Planctomycetia bacterium]|nr:hypothetical protein [Planctomycetia bacterium]